MNPADFAFLAPELFLAFIGMFLLIGATLKGPDMARKINIAAGVSFVVALGGVVYLAKVAALFDQAAMPVFGGHIAVGPYELLIKAVLLLAALAALVLAHVQMKSKEAQAEYPVLILFATLGMMLMVSAQSLLGLYVGLELQSLTLYVLAAIRRDDAKSSEAGLKYFVLGALASGLLLYGISLVYGATGSIMFDKIQNALGSDKPGVEIILGFVMILSALAFKISAAPFHMWTPDVYEGAPTPVTAFFAAAPKLAGFALLIKILAGPFADLSGQAQQILVALSILSMAWGAFAAIAQSNIKRLMAYSSIGHVGFALVGLVAGGEQGITATLTYLLIYVPMTLGAFAIILSLNRDGQPLEQLSDLAGFSKTRPALAALMAVWMFSMIGIPPLAGFFGKLYVFMAAIEQGYVWLAILGVVLSVVGAFYYLRIIKIMYFDKPEGRFDRMPGWGVGSVLGVCAFFILGFIISPSLIGDLIQQAVKSLLAA
jgi:NADH-quinone oxidoreductase subunit N